MVDGFEEGADDFRAGDAFIPVEFAGVIGPIKGPFTSSFGIAESGNKSFHPRNFGGFSGDDIDTYDCDVDVRGLRFEM